MVSSQRLGGSSCEDSDATADVRRSSFVAQDEASQRRRCFMMGCKKFVVSLSFVEIVRGAKRSVRAPDVDLASLSVQPLLQVT